MVDVLVVGAGSAGSTAAIAAARTGASTLLVDRLGFLGGTSTAVLDTFYAFYTPGAEPRKVVAGIPVRDTTSGYRGYRRCVLEKTDFDRIKIEGFAVHGEMAYQAWVNGFRLGEVPIHFKNRARDASKLSGREIYMAVLNFALLRVRYGFRPRRRREPTTGA